MNIQSYKVSKIRGAIYIALAIAITVWLFAPYWGMSYAIAANIGCVIAYSLLCIIVQHIPCRNHTSRSIKRNEKLVSGAVLFMIIATALIVPLIWYFEKEESPYMDECAFVALYVLPFSIVAFEAQILLNQTTEAIKTPPYRIWLIALVCVFGFLGLKELCQYIMNYSGENFFISMFLLFIMILGPILLILGIYSYFIWDKILTNGKTKRARNSKTFGYHRINTDADTETADNGSDR